MIENILIATSKNDVSDSNGIVSTYFNTNNYYKNMQLMCYIEYMFYLYSGLI